MRTPLPKLDDTTATIEFALAEGATSLTIDTDMGEVVLSPDEAAEAWEDMAPGEGFEILCVLFAM